MEWLRHYRIFNGNGNCFVTVLHLICEMLLKVNYTAVKKGKRVNGFYKSKDDHLMRVSEIPHNIFSNDFLYSSLIQFL